MVSSKIVLVGGGGHCKSVIDSLQKSKEFTITGIVDNNLCIGTIVCGIKVIGGDDSLADLFNQGINKCFVCIGSVGNYKLRRKVIDMITNLGFDCINVIDQTAVVSENVVLGKGIFIGKNCIVNSESRIDDYAIINTGSIIEHECIIEPFVHVSPGSVLGGNVTLKYGSHIGLNSTIIEGVCVGESCMIGAGSTVLTDVSDHQKKWGVIHEK